ncbi:crustacyanin-A2 subunit-like isoform X2 [Panulirus ornatus]|uniref:crustacyanin-A2 subunit-like isoform X2 n=1 Tax=Panulirus ornatus TaxID=150431 RepID=UPI003A8C1700
MWLQLLPWLMVWCCARAQAASCPKLELKKDFSLDKYMGVWYEIQAQESIFQRVKSCLSSDYQREGEVIKVTSQGLDSSGKPAETRSTLRVVQPDNPAHMVTDFVMGIDPPFDIVDTDYVTFSCAHSCVSIMGIKTEFVFIYSRNRTLDTVNVEHCHKIFKAKQLR